MINTRPGIIDDFDAVLSLMDEAIAWLVSQGRTGQWGSEAFSANPAHSEYMRREVETNELWIAEAGGQAVGAMLLGEKPMPYVAAVDERELYLHLLVTSRRYAGQGVGQVLVDRVRAIAIERGIDLIRVDCYAGDDRKLVRAYERLGFVPAESFTVKDWPGQVLAMRMSDSMSNMDIEC
jgi:GNAT superfamily N-acetyltransferase